MHEIGTVRQVIAIDGSGLLSSCRWRANCWGRLRRRSSGWASRRGIVPLPTTLARSHRSPGRASRSKWYGVHASLRHRLAMGRHGARTVAWPSNNERFLRHWENRQHSGVPGNPGHFRPIHSAKWWITQRQLSPRYRMVINFCSPGADLQRTGLTRRRHDVSGDSCPKWMGRTQMARPRGSRSPLTAGRESNGIRIRVYWQEVRSSV